MIPTRLLLPLGITLLAGCAQNTHTLTLQHNQQDRCPLQLSRQQTLILSLPSNPTSGFRWQLEDAAAPVLRSLGPEVYSNPQGSGLVGSAGQSTWRFQAARAGEGHLRLRYQRPWEADVAPSERFDCLIRVK